MFEELVVEQAGVTSIMCAYNQLNGTSSCHNAGLLGPTGLVHAAGFQGDFYGTTIEIL
jgi:beta-glucosidase